MLIWFSSNDCILRLVLNIWNQGKNSEIRMARFLFSNGRISPYFDNIRLKLPTDAYFEVRFHTMLSKYENSKNIFL